MRLSKHFSLEELTQSDTAVRLDIDNTPTVEVIDNLTFLAEKLEDVRDYYALLCLLVVASVASFLIVIWEAEILPVTLKDWLSTLYHHLLAILKLLLKPLWNLIYNTTKSFLNLIVGFISRFLKKNQDSNL